MDDEDGDDGGGWGGDVGEGGILARSAHSAMPSSLYAHHHPVRTGERP